MASRYITNDFSPLLTLGDTKTYLQAALEDIVTNYPPRADLAGVRLAGLWSGPTGIAYLFLHISSLHPELKTGGQDALTWAKAYIHGSRDHVALDSTNCGIINERLVYDAVQASITKDLTHVKNFVSHVPAIVDGAYANDLFGRAGTLYLLRMIHHWVPNSARILVPSITAISDKILADGTDWKWRGRRYLGAVHGDIAIVTQLVLTNPELAHDLEPKLVQLLDLQLPDGNWTNSEGKESPPLTQICHGAPGFVTSLVSLRPYFLNLEHRVDECIRRGRECIWKEGLLRKEPSLCHGIFGNAL